MSNYKLATYDYVEVDGFKSVIDQKGYKYPKGPAENEVVTISSHFNDYDFDYVHPLVSAIFEEPMSMTEFTGGTVTLRTDLTTDGAPIVIDENCQPVLVNLNGKKIEGSVFTESNGEITEGNSDSYVFWVKNGGELTIEGSGEVIAKEATYSMAVWANGGKVVIKEGKFYNNGNNSDLIYASNGGQVEIYGGEFHANENKGDIGTKNAFPALNIKDKDRATTSIRVFGGKFYGFNPADNLSEGPNTNFVAEGYESVEVEPGVWEVREK